MITSTMFWLESLKISLPNIKKRWFVVRILH